MKQKDFILMLGPQSSGKSTQAKQLAEHLGYKFISSGKLLRRLSEANNPIGVKLSQYWIKGDLVPDDLIEEVIYPVFEHEDVAGFVVDGYPRNLGQLKGFLPFLEMNGWKISKVFYLSVSEAEALRRIKIRSETEHRLDEANEESIRHRIDIYHKETEPLLNEYSNMGILTKVDGERTIEEIQTELRNYFG